MISERKGMMHALAGPEDVDVNGILYRPTLQEF